MEFAVNGKRKENCTSNRVLGTIAMICAPALLVEALVQGQKNGLIDGLASMVFMAGWICANTAMRRMRATGTGTWRRAVLLIQLVGLVLAFMFGFLEATELLGRQSIIFNITDAAWPLSMLWMVVVGISVIVAKRLSGWKRFVPMLCPFWFPTGIVAMRAFGDKSGVVGFGLAAVLWVLLGYVVRTTDGRQPASTPEPAVQ